MKSEIVADDWIVRTSVIKYAPFRLHDYIDLWISSQGSCLSLSFLSCFLGEYSDHYGALQVRKFGKWSE